MMRIAQRHRLMMMWIAPYHLRMTVLATSIRSLRLSTTVSQCR
jgi:hypothetical protein